MSEQGDKWPINSVRIYSFVLLFDLFLCEPPPPKKNKYNKIIPQWKKATELFGCMIRDGKMPEKHTINLIIELLDAEGQYEKVTFLFDSPTNESNQSDQSHRHPRVDAKRNTRSKLVYCESSLFPCCLLYCVW